MRAQRNVKALLKQRWFAARAMGYKIHHFNLSPDLFEQYRKIDKKEEKMFYASYDDHISVRSYGWKQHGNTWYLFTDSQSGREALVNDMETVLYSRYEELRETS
jgi:hypothetical protein